MASAPPQAVTDGPRADLPPARGHIGSRDAAYEQLREIAAYLARVEPHSPVPMVLETLVAWRDMRFEDLLAHLPAQGGASVYELLKLFKPDSPR